VQDGDGGRREALLLKYLKAKRDRSRVCFQYRVDVEIAGAERTICGYAFMVWAEGRWHIEMFWDNRFTCDGYCVPTMSWYSRTIDIIMGRKCRRLQDVIEERLEPLVLDAWEGIDKCTIASELYSHSAS